MLTEKPTPPSEAPSILFDDPLTVEIADEHTGSVSRIVTLLSGRAGIGYLVDLPEMNRKERRSKAGKARIQQTEDEAHAKALNRLHDYLEGVAK